jgi:hypothetical protein
MKQATRIEIAVTVPGLHEERELFITTAVRTSNASTLRCTSERLSGYWRWMELSKDFALVLDLLNILVLLR